MDYEHLVLTLVYTGFGIVTFTVALIAMARFAPFSLHKEIEEDQNVAVGIVMGAILLGLAHIIAAAVGA